MNRYDFNHDQAWILAKYVLDEFGGSMPLHEGIERFVDLKAKLIEAFARVIENQQSIRIHDSHCETVSKSIPIGLHKERLSSRNRSQRGS